MKFVVYVYEVIESKSEDQTKKQNFAITLIDNPALVFKTLADVIRREISPNSDEECKFHESFKIFQSTCSVEVHCCTKNYELIYLNDYNNNYFIVC